MVTKQTSLPVPAIMNPKHGFDVNDPKVLSLASTSPTIALLRENVIRIQEQNALQASLPPPPAPDPHYQEQVAQIDKVAASRTGNQFIADATEKSQSGEWDVQAASEHLGSLTHEQGATGEFRAKLGEYAAKGLNIVQEADNGRVEAQTRDALINRLFRFLRGSTQLRA